MTQASGAQDPTEARGPEDRGWFQPPNRPPAADAGDTQNETQPSKQISVIRAAERSDDNEPPTAIQAPLARKADPQKPKRPVDITRPQLILDDTVIDIAGSRGGQNPRPTTAPDG